MAVVHGYCTVDDVRAELDDTGSKLNTALVEKAIGAASRAIDNWCGRRFWQDSAPVARTYDPQDPYCVDVDDIATKTGLVVKLDAGGDGSYATTLTPALYQLGPRNADADGGAYAWRRIASLGPLLAVCGTRPRPDYLQVTARWGWSQVPVEIEQACVLKAVSLFKRKDAPFGIAGFTDFGAVRITRKDPDVIELLSAYAIGGIA